MTEDEFERYRQRVGKVLADCLCDEVWPNECCRKCIALGEKFIAEEKKHLEERRKNGN